MNQSIAIAAFQTTFASKRIETKTAGIFIV
jgi:hypothetical protein